MYYFSNSWNTGSLTGNLQVMFNFTNPNWIAPTLNHFPNTGINYTAGHAAFTGGNYNLAANPYNIITDTASVQRWENQTFNLTSTTTYDNFIYNRTVSGKTTSSRVILSDDIHGIFYDDESTNDIFYPYILTKPYYLSVLDFEGGWHNYTFWYATSGGSFTLDVDKGKESTDYLIPNEQTTARVSFNGNTNNIGYIHYTWSQGTSSGGAGFTTSRSYRYNSTKSKFEYEYLPVGVSDWGNFTLDQVLTQTISFMYDDFDGNWTSTHTPHNWIRLNMYDKSYNGFTPETGIVQYLYVGNSNLNPQTIVKIKDIYNAYLTTGTLYVYDNTTSAYVINGELINTGAKFVNTPVGHSYFAWATVPDYAFSSAFYDYDNPDSNMWQISSQSLGGSSFTVRDAGIRDDVLFYQTTGLNATTYPIISFYVKDNTNIPIPIARITISPKPTFDNAVHTTSFSGWDQFICDNGTRYNYTVTKNGYDNVLGSFTAIKGLSINVVMYPTVTTTPTPTPTVTGTVTVTVTPTGTELGAGNGTFGTSTYQPGNFINYLLNLFAMSLGLSLSDAKVFLGLFITVFFAIFVGYFAHFKGEAVGIGAIIGFSGSFALHLIPVLWILIPIIFVTLYIVIKMWGNVGAGT
jgi:hypothetical protein